MTIRFLKSWNGYAEQSIVSGINSGEESRLIGLGFATTDLDGEAVNQPLAKLATDANGNVTGLSDGSGGILGILKLADYGQINGTKLRRFRAKLANSSNSPTNIGWYGHSIISGGYSNGVLTAPAAAGDAADLAWDVNGCVGQLRKGIARTYGEVCSGITPPCDSAGVRFVMGGGASRVGPATTIGFAGTRASLSAAAHTATITINLTGYTGASPVARVFALGSNLLTTTHIPRYQVDGGALTEVVPTIQSLSPNGTNYFMYFDIPLVTNASHNVLIQAPSSGTEALYITGVSGISDTTQGVYVHRYGYSGYCLPDLFATAIDTTDTQGAFLAYKALPNSLSQQLQSCTSSHLIDLAIITTDVNDMTKGWTTYTYSLTDVQRHIQNTVNSLVALGIDVVLACGLFRDTSSNAAGIPYTQAEVIAVYKAVADATDHVAFIDFTKGWLSYSDANTSGLYIDTVHPNQRGHAELGRLMANAILNMRQV